MPRNYLRRIECRCPLAKHRPYGPCRHQSGWIHGRHRPHRVRHASEQGQLGTSEQKRLGAVLDERNGDLAEHLAFRCTGTARLDPVSP